MLQELLQRATCDFVPFLILAATCAVLLVPIHLAKAAANFMKLCSELLQFTR